MNHARRAALLSIVTLVLHMSPELAASEIWTPRLHNPAFVEPGNTFVAEVRASSTHVAGGWSAMVQNDLRSWNCTVSAVWGRIHHRLEDGWVLTIRVPADTTPELCGLTIRHSSGDDLTSIRSVQVVKQFETNFYILHLSDVHVADPIARQASGETAKSGNGSTDAMKWAAPVVNLINPRFVMYTGDNFHAYYEANSWGGVDLSTNRLHWFQDGLNAYNVATPITTGNHDIGYSSYIYSQEWRAQYEREMGQRNFSWRMGSFYVMSQEFSFIQYLDWARADYAAAYADPSIKFRLVAMHYPDNWSNPCDATNPCNLLIAGHSHGTSRLQTTPFPIVTVGTALDRQKAAFYDFQKSGSNWNCPQIPVHAEGVNVFRLVGDWGAPKITSSYAVPNDGTRDTNMATIVNGLNQDFYNGRVRFLLPRGTYTLTGGSIEATYDYNNGSNTAVLAKVNIIKNSTTTVSIARTTTPPQTPEAPTNLSASASSVSQINLTWIDNAANEGGFKIERKTSAGGAWAQIATVAANINTYSNTGLSSATQYFFRVRANNPAGDSGYSNEAAVTTHTPPLPVGTGAGLRGDYFDNQDLTVFKISRVDTTVDFDWGDGAPDASIGADTFSAVWRGEVQAQANESYTFYTHSDDGIRLWVNGVTLIDNWTDHGPTENSGSIALTAGQKYAIRLEFYENGGGAVAKLSWSSASTPKQIIPRTQLYPAAANRTPTLVSNVIASPNPATTDNTVTFTAFATDADGDALSYAWNFGDGTTGTGATASRKYATPGQYTSTVTVTDTRGSGTLGSVNVTITTPALPPVNIKINFQLAGAATPPGCLPDAGAPFADRGNGYSYGWNADNSSTARDRNAANSPDQRYDTLIHLQKPENPNAAWEIAISNGQYTVRVVCGDPSYFDSVFKLNVEDVLIVNATPTATAKWFEGTQTVNVNDGRLTISNAVGAANNKICFLEINNGIAAREIAAEAPEAFPLIVAKLQLAVNFARPGLDSYRVNGVVESLPSDFRPEDQRASIDVGAAIADFTLDPKGRGRSKSGIFALKQNEKGTGWLFQASVKKGKWKEAWNDGGLQNATTSLQTEVPVVLTIGTQSFGGSKRLTYKAKEQKSGDAK